MKMKVILILIVAFVSSLAIAGCSKEGGEAADETKKGVLEKETKKAEVERMGKLSEKTARAMKKGIGDRLSIPPRMKGMKAMAESLVPFPQSTLAGYLPEPTEKWETGESKGHDAKDRDDPQYSYASRTYKGEGGTVTVTIKDTMLDRKHIKEVRKRTMELRQNKELTSKRLKVDGASGFEFFDPKEKTTYAILRIFGRVVVEVDARNTAKPGISEDFFKMTDINKLGKEVRKSLNKAAREKRGAGAVRKFRRGGGGGSD